MKALLIDYYDSFSFNVVDAFERCGVNQIEHIYSDQIDLTKAPECDFIILSPGPNHPNDEQKSQELVLSNHTRIPIFGICLGHQIICASFGAQIVRIPSPHHGAVKDIFVDINSSLFESTMPVLSVATYNSLGIEVSDLSDSPLKIVARSEDGIVEAIERDSPTLPYLASTQFHPESFLSEKSDVVIKNFLSRVKARRDQ